MRVMLPLMPPIVAFGASFGVLATSAGIALALTPITPAGMPVIAATAACLVGLARPRRAHVAHGRLARETGS
jgi:hypothetical protein